MESSRKQWEGLTEKTMARGATGELAKESGPGGQGWGGVGRLGEQAVASEHPSSGRQWEPYL